MKAQEIQDEWIHLEENDPPPDLSREDAAFERERARLVREHLGKFAVVRFDEVGGVYDTFDEAMADAHRRFGWGRMIVRTITAQNETAYIANVDTNHPSFKPLD